MTKTKQSYLRYYIKNRASISRIDNRNLKANFSCGLKGKHLCSEGHGVTKRSL